MCFKNTKIYEWLLKHFGKVYEATLIERSSYLERMVFKKVKALSKRSAIKTLSKFYIVIEIKVCKKEVK